jgi:valyl-tRNA synthetase
MMAPWPDVDASFLNEDAEARLRALQELIASTRSLRKEYGVGEGDEIEVALATEDPAFRETVESEAPALSRLARVSAVRWERAVEGTIGAHSVLTNGAELFLPLEGVIDLARERERLAQEIGRLEGQVRSSEGKLSNEQFVQRAPADVVEREREKVRSQREQLAKLQEKLALFRGRG